ncbi:hypothetical protein BCR36DRAFT_369294 [Piromyces finnis]|uniref:DUF4219 domain-containing protein n=1 Tax=Piromyces finnis TaxID=1754191 RepID=A0A1Y1VDS8_9FUNG|nr:hypothetical protein BCR36DRAFT_369294 [Piromyces finnis]|eukprot:ORX53041.1 hypothetical protein BCR36DRAFT_369294 [Piromyces finnis]
MFEELQFQPTILTEGNYDIWCYTIKYLLRGKGVLEYIQKDVIGDLERKIEEIKNDDDGGTAKDELTQRLKMADRNDAIAMAIINYNLNLETREMEDLQSKIIKLYSIKARNLEELPSIIRKIKNIFTSIEKQDTKIMSEVEKVKIIYYALPKYLQERMTISTKIKSDEFIEEVIDKHLMITYLKDKLTISKIDNILSQKKKFSIKQKQFQITNTKANLLKTIVTFAKRIIIA